MLDYLTSFSSKVGVVVPPPSLPESESEAVAKRFLTGSKGDERHRTLEIRGAFLKDFNHSIIYGD